MSFLKNISNYKFIIIPTFIISICIGIYINSNKNTLRNTVKKTKNYMSFERVIDEENKIYIGIYDYRQVIVLNYDRNNKNNQYYRLIILNEKENKLIYYFENDIIMIIEKKNDFYTLYIDNIPNHSKKELYKIINPVIIKSFRTIGMKKISDDIDKIYDFFK